MELSEFKSLIDACEPLREAVGPLIVFSCEDRGVANAYVDRIASVYGCERVRCDSVAEAVEASSSGGLVDEAERLFVVRDDLAFASDEKAWGNAPRSGLAIAIYDAKDVRAAFSKTMGGAVVPFGKISAKVMAEQIAPNELGVEASSNAMFLCDCCGNDYDRVCSEADKARRYAVEAGVSVDEAIWALWRAGQLGRPSSEDRFRFANAFMASEASAFDDAYSGEPLELIGMLYSQCRASFLALANAGRQDACKATGMSYAQLRAAEERGRPMGEGGLLRTMGVLRKAELGIKTGTIPKELAMKYVMAKAFRTPGKDKR